MPRIGEPKTYAQKVRAALRIYDDRIKEIKSARRNERRAVNAEFDKVADPLKAELEKKLEAAKEKRDKELERIEREYEEQENEVVATYTETVNSIAHSNGK